MNPLSVQMSEDGEIDCSPTYLFDYSSQYKRNAREAGSQWYSDAFFGLGIHYGLYSLLGRGENALRDKVATPEEYRLLTGKLTAANFNAIDIVELAISTGMRYVTFSVRTADGFSLYNSQVSDYNCAKTPARRDLLGELASVCEMHGIGLCLQLSHGFDWSRTLGVEEAVPEEELFKQPAYEDLMFRQLEELLTQYGPIAAICLDGIEAPLKATEDERKNIQNLYDFVHHLQPQVLLSYGQGLLGTEDFFTCEDKLPELVTAPSVQGFIHRQSTKKTEIRMSMTPGSWGYCAEKAGSHHDADRIWEKLSYARRNQCNLLVNTALMPDGSLDYEDMKTLITVGERVEKNGYPD